MRIFTTLKLSNGSVSLKLGSSCVIVLVVLSFLVPLLFDLDPYRISDNLRASIGLWNGSGPLLGTDDLGRDVLARLVFGARNSVGIGLAVVLVSMSVGIPLGLFAGVYGGWIDTSIMRVTGILMTLPTILLAIVIVSVLGAGLLTAMCAATIVAIPGFIRVVRSISALEMKRQYVQAARTGGDSKLQILWSEVLPNCWVPIVAQATLGFGDAILHIAALDFLGLGAKPPMAEWGAMLADARPFIESNPNLIVLPGLCLATTIFGFTLLGDALQRWLNPRTGVH